MNFRAIEWKLPMTYEFGALSELQLASSLKAGLNNQTSYNMELSDKQKNKTDTTIVSLCSYKSSTLASVSLHFVFEYVTVHLHDLHCLCKRWFILYAFIHINPS